MEIHFDVKRIPRTVTIIVVGLIQAALSGIIPMVSDLEMPTATTPQLDLVAVEVSTVEETACDWVNNALVTENLAVILWVEMYILVRALLELEVLAVAPK
jgi:hypothetical protein